MGNDESLRLCESAPLACTFCLPTRPGPRFLGVLTPVFEDDGRSAICRMLVLIGVSGLLRSLRIAEASTLRAEREDGARGWLDCMPDAPPAEPVRLMASAANGPSGPGWGDGAGEPLAATAARRICARSCAACRSVSQATCWSRKSTVTWNLPALYVHISRVSR